MPAGAGAATPHPQEERKEESWPPLTAIRVPGTHHMAPLAGAPAARMRLEGSQHIYRKQTWSRRQIASMYTQWMPLAEGLIRITARPSSQSPPAPQAGWSSETAGSSARVEMGGYLWFEGVRRSSATSSLHLLPQHPWPENYLEHSRLFRVGGIHPIVKPPQLRVVW